MRNLIRLRKLWNDVLDEDEAERRVLAWILEAALARHKPFALDSSTTIRPDSPNWIEPWCMVCVTHWPCDRWVKVAGLAEKLDIDGS